MGRIVKTVRGVVKHGNLIAADVLSMAGGRVSVRLSTNGAVYRNLPMVGGPVSVGQTVGVDFTTTIPSVVAPGTVADIAAVGGRKIRRTLTPPRVQKTKTVTDKIEVYTGPPPTTGRPLTLPKGVYTANDAGLTSAIQLCVDGDVIYLPQCTISGQHEIPDFDDQEHALVRRITMIGVTRDDSILTGKLIVGGNTVLKDLTVSVTGSSASIIDAITTIGDAEFYNLKISAVNTGAGLAIGVDNVWECNVNMYDCEIAADDYGIYGNYNGGLDTMNVAYDSVQGFWDTATPDNVTPNGYSFQFGECISSGSAYYLKEAAWYELIGPPQAFEVGTEIHLIFQINGTDVYLGDQDPEHPYWLEDMSFYAGAVPGEVITQMSSLDESFPQYVDGAFGWFPLGMGHWAEWIWYNTPEISVDGFNRIWFAFTRNVQYDNPGMEHEIVPLLVYAREASGKQIQLFPTRFLAYLKNCKITSGTTDLYGGAYSMITAEDCRFRTKAGFVTIKYAGQIAVYQGTTEPTGTFPGMFWVQE